MYGCFPEIDTYCCSTENFIVRPIVVRPFCPFDVSTMTTDKHRQYVWIVRYGLTHPPLEEGVGPYDSDIDPDLGIQHAEAIAHRLAATANTEQFPSLILSSPFRRCAHTAHIIASKLSSCGRKTMSVCIEEGLTEWLTPPLVVNRHTNVRTVPKSPQQLIDDYGYTTIYPCYISANPSVTDDQRNEFFQSSIPGTKTPEFPENEAQLHLRMSTTWKKLLLLNPKENIVIVSHAPCIQALTYAALREDKAATKPWPLGGITLLSRDTDGWDNIGEENDKGWKLEFYGSTNHMPGEYQQGLKSWSLPGFSSLP